jgi:hypothetical protein
MVDNVVLGNSTTTLGLDFIDYFLASKPSILAVTEDDKYGDVKRKLCEQTNSRYIVLPKTPPSFTPVSTTTILSNIRAPDVVPLRVDFAGGWLDVPRFAQPSGYITNCTISPLVSLHNWPYELRGGLGGSGAHAILTGTGASTYAVEKELALGVGWQDPAVITETGLCVWVSGDRPLLDVKLDPNGMLKNKMGIYWTGEPHDTPSTALLKKDLEGIKEAGLVARDAVWSRDYGKLCQAVNMSYQLQLEEGMKPLESKGEIAKKYCGGGFGGYALYMFRGEKERDMADGIVNVEPYVR